MSAPTIEEQIEAVNNAMIGNEGSAHYYEHNLTPDMGLANQFRAEADALDAAAETLKRMQWQPIETCPADEWVMFYCDAEEGSRGGTGKGKCQKVGDPIFFNGLFNFDAKGPITHWMPLPAIPTQDAKAPEKPDA